MLTCKNKLMANRSEERPRKKPMRSRMKSLRTRNLCQSHQSQKKRSLLVHGPFSLKERAQTLSVAPSSFVATPITASKERAGRKTLMKRPALVRSSLPFLHATTTVPKLWKKVAVTMTTGWRSPATVFPEKIAGRYGRFVLTENRPPATFVTDP